MLPLVRPPLLNIIIFVVFVVVIRNFIYIVHFKKMLQDVSQKIIMVIQLVKQTFEKGRAVAHEH